MVAFSVLIIQYLLTDGLIRSHNHMSNIYSWLVDNRAYFAVALAAIVWVLATVGKISLQAETQALALLGFGGLVDIQQTVVGMKASLMGAKK